MSIPGLATSISRTVTLSPAWEWRFEIPIGASLTVKLLSGTAEKDGVELAPRTAYTLAGQKSRLLSWHGCELEVSGRTASEAVASYARAADNPATAVVNLHAYLSEMRAAASPTTNTTTTTTNTTAAAAAASAETRPGPRVLVAGAPGTGKTTLARTLVSYAARQGAHVVAVNVDPAEGMLSLAGTLSAAVYATPADAEARDGWGATPTSGASAASVKTPVVYALGRQRAGDGGDGGRAFRQLVGRLAGAVSGRLSEDAAVRAAGVVVDSMGVEEEAGGEGSEDGVELLAHVVDELSINVVVVLGSPGLHAVLAKRFASERTSLGEVIQVVPLDKSDGVAERDETYMRYFREATIKEYFFGDARRTLSPQIQQVDFDSVLIYKVADDGGLVREEPSSIMQHWTLAVMHASLREPPEVVRVANVMGFVYVADVDEERRKVKILAPVGGRLGDKPMIWGRWPEPYINLLG
ncbi:mRNA cleavage and polyadenylation factor CLP1 [Escovopsis weberi]|uniref:Polynucleotide 5'-hydroxyl-kinase GRC3 n=1 Tax=Escovopsis weberi TaxID=150374 RepID=A0A0M9VV61_ESCWE|nr:mRNA cleavage and polyadenylation factor CLP1 [Escovopsis weberi]